MEKFDDSYYIEMVLHGQTNHFSYLVEKYKDIVFSIALKVLKNREEAEEMAQESFLKAYNSLKSFKGGSQFSTWLYRITYNTCISELRKRKIKFTSTEDIQLKDDETDEINLDGIPTENRARYIQDAMSKLDEDDYILILLHYFKEKTIEEVSKITGLSESNTKVKLFRARKKLGQILNEMLQEELYTIL